MMIKSPETPDDFTLIADVECACGAVLPSLQAWVNHVLAVHP